MIYELNHIGIMVRDINATVAFYEKLDARIVYSLDFEGRGGLRYMQIAGSMLEFVGINDKSRMPEGYAYGIDHLAFMTDDLDTDYQRLLDYGCTVVGDGIHPTAAKNGYLGKVYRPDGAKIELLQREVDFRLPQEDGVVVAFDHYAYQVEDIGEASEFFNGLLGLPHLADMKTKDGEVIRSFSKIKNDVLGLRAGAPKTPGDHFPHFVLRVDDVDLALATLAERGITPVEPAADSPSGMGKNAFLADPDGVRIELLDRPELGTF